MAEFCEVMKQAARMCKAYGGECRKCPADDSKHHICMIWPEAIEYRYSTPKQAEQIVMDWAAKNPESRFPTWEDAWMKLFPGADLIPCPRKHFGFDFACIGEDNCQTCVKRQIYPFVAEKLGVKPIGVANDG